MNRDPTSVRDPLVSVILPAHNEAAGIEAAVHTVRRILDAAGLRNEIIVVDDGSRDGTFLRVEAVARALDDVVGIRLSRNFGKEAAILAGLRAVRGDVAVTMDSDLQHPPDIIPRMVEAWRSGVMVVHGTKQERASDSAIRRARALLYGWVSKTLSGLDLRNASDFKLLDRRVVQVVADQLPERQRLYRGLVPWVGFRQGQVVFDTEERVAGKTQFSLRDLVALAMTGIIAFTNAPLRIITVLGLLTLLLSVAVAIDTLWTWYQGTAVSGFATTVLVEMIIGSFIMISLGILGEYVAKMYDEVKRRPSYFVSDTVSGADRDAKDGRV